MKSSYLFYLLQLLIINFAVFGLEPATAIMSSQDEAMKPMTRKECVKKANEKFSDLTTEASIDANKELIQLIQELETETDPAKKKVLEEKKKVEMTKFLEKIDIKANKLCDRIIK